VRTTAAPADTSPRSAHAARKSSRGLPGGGTAAARTAAQEEEEGEAAWSSIFRKLLMFGMMRAILSVVPSQ
jgi:hypothetical protein